MQKVPRPAAACPDPSHVGCRHSRQPFDQGFHVVSHRGDLSSDAKVVHAYLVSLHRRGIDLAQRQIAADVGLTRHRVWSAIRELVSLDLVQTIRYGLGQPNGYVLLGLSGDDLNGTARPETGVRPVRKAQSGQSGNLARAGTYGQKIRENGRKSGYTQPSTGGDFLETRYGRLPTGCAGCGSQEHRGMDCPVLNRHLTP